MKSATWYVGIDADRDLNECFEALRRLAAVVDASDDEHRRVYTPELEIAKARLAVLEALDNVDAALMCSDNLPQAARR